MEQHGKELRASGWYLSEKGLAHCTEQCKEKGWAITTGNLKKVALDADLRLIGSGALSDDISRNLTSEVNGPIVLQIHKIKNTATPSTKQHNPSPSKRLLRVQLTDGLVHVSAVELEGSLRNFSPTTPPGTKVKLVGKVAVQNGFLLLKQTSLEVLGGTVEALYKKWVAQKSGTDNLERSKGDAGPPKFTPFKGSGLISTKAGGERSIADTSTGQMKKQSTYRVQSKSTEEARSQKNPYESKLTSDISRDTHRVQGKSRPEEQLRSNRAAAKTHKQERDRGDGGDNEHKYQVQSSGFKQERRSDTSAKGRGRESSNNWRNEEPHYERGRRGRGRGRGRNQSDHEDYKPPSMSTSVQLEFQSSGVHESQHERGRGRRGRGRGRRGRQTDDDDTYQPSKPSSGHSLGDWFDQKLVLNKKPSYMSKYWDDYDYSDLYYGQEEPHYRDSYSHEDSRNSAKPRAKKGFTEPQEEYPPMPSKTSSKSTKQVISQRGHKYSKEKGRTKEAWMEEDYPSMPSRSKMPMSQPQAGQSEGGGGHWDWVGLAAGSSAPSSALKKRTVDS